MSHPRRESYPEGEQNRRNPGEKGQVGRPPLDEGAEPGPGPHEHAVEVLRGKPELMAQLLLVHPVKIEAHQHLPVTLGR